MVGSGKSRPWIASATVAAAMSIVLAASAAVAAVGSDLATPQKKEIAMELVSSAENSTLNWRAQYSYIEDIHDGRGYTGGIIGFTSGTGDMLEVVRNYTTARRHNPLARFLAALRRVNGSASHRGLGPSFVAAWKLAAKDRAFQRAQENERDRVYFNPAVGLAKSDGLRALGQFAYYDAAVVHGFDGLQAVRARALTHAQPPAAGGDEVAYLNAFLDERDVEMRKEAAHSDLSRVEKEQRKFLREGNLDLNPPLRWSTYGDPYSILR
jgi:chitosanase